MKELKTRLTQYNIRLIMEFKIGLLQLDLNLSMHRLFQFLMGMVEINFQIIVQTILLELLMVSYKITKILSIMQKIPIDLLQMD